MLVIGGSCHGRFGHGSTNLQRYQSFFELRSGARSNDGYDAFALAQDPGAALAIRLGKAGQPQLMPQPQPMLMLMP